MASLDATARREFLAANPGWVLDGETITKTYLLANFNEAMGLVTRVAMLSEVADHHPDIDIRWNKVTISLSTHSESALTGKDTDLARAIERF